MLNLFEQMKRRRKSSGWLAAALMGIVAAGCGEAVVEAPPAKVTFENSLFRILDLNLPPGTTLEHSYENDVATIVMGASESVRTHGPGQNWDDEAATTVGGVRVGEAGAQGVQNRGMGSLQLFAIENLREDGGAKPEPLAGTGMTLVAESAAFGAYDVRLADNNFQISHTHTAPAVAVLVNGRILSQGAESKDPAVGTAPSGLKQLDQPGQWVFVPAGEAHFVVRLGADPSHLVEIELR